MTLLEKLKALFFRIPFGWIIALLLTICFVLNFLDYYIPEIIIYLTSLLVLGVFVGHILRSSLSQYLLQRVLGAFASLFFVATLTFVLLRILPGGPFDTEKALPPEVKANIEAKYQLNAPLYEQYGSYILNLFKGNLGESYKYLGRSVTDIIIESFPVSFQLGMYALVISFLIGIPMGVVSAARHNQSMDRWAMFLAVSGVSLPSFLVAPILIYIFSFYFKLLPPAFWNGPEYYILPSFVLGVRPAAVIARLTRSSVLEVIRSDYIRTAKAKGLSAMVVLYKHVLKNSLIPVLTFSGPLLAGILSGSFIIELIFSVPGMGKHLIQSVSNRDYPLILGMTLIFSFMLILSNLIVDLLYSYFDPRIKLNK